MNVSTAFKAVHGLNLHFARMDYSILKYGLNTKRANDLWAKTTPQQKFRYEWLSERFHVMEDLVFACIGSTFDGIDVRYATKEQILDAYFKLKRRREGLDYTIKENTNRCEFLGIEDNFQKMFQEYIGGRISPEFIILSDKSLDKLKAMYADNNFAWCSTKVLHLLKYKPFLPATYFQQVKENETAAA